ncbi:MAG TPA: tRNA epoxyqueuosine(34) reductase QueG [Nitrospiria bacterium]|jgi:epoxyqueuosine reductase|nr:tRNA epoxyqueuosine(34) reductase QueG [Nitrospiria bacterium]
MEPVSDSFTANIKAYARKIGFDLVGITTAEILEEDEQHLAVWLEAGFAGEMAYMARSPSRRARPQELLPDAKSVICLGLYYYPGEPSEPDPDSLLGEVSRYAWGKDYHQVIEHLLDELIAYLKKQTGSALKFKTMVDHGPVLEKALAQRAGLGFIGKNTLLIHQDLGSWVFLAELITNLDLEPDKPQFNQCGSCTACLSACPTGALVQPFVLDARRCISYLTIELKGEIPESLRPQMEDWVFGCDICQEVCPFNAQQKTIGHPYFTASEGAGPWLSLSDVLAVREDQDFKAKFSETPLLRPKRQGLQRNAAAVAQNLESAGQTAGRNKNG